MLALKNLTFRYDNKVIFRRFSHSFPEQTLCFGLNGSGKSTLIKLIAGLLTPENGSIWLDDRNDFHASILMDNRILFNEFTLSSHFDWILDEFSISYAAVKQQIQLFDIETWLDRKPAELSEGERQWAALALVTVITADIYLLDEPIRSLDNDRILQLCDIIQHKIQAGNRFFLTAHQPEPFDSVLEPFEMNALL